MTDSHHVQVIGTSTELQDSRSLFGDWQALRARVASDGYVFIRGLLDPDMIRAVGRCGLGHLQQAGWLEQGSDPVSAVPRRPVRAVKMRDAFVDPGYRQILADPGFNRIAFVSPLADLMSQILGPAGFCYPGSCPGSSTPLRSLLVSLATSSTRTTGRYKTCSPAGFPSALSPAGSGASPSNRAATRPPGCATAPWSISNPAGSPPTTNAGDVLVFHCLTTHAALPNGEEQMRFSAEYRWQLADQPAPRRLVIGPRGRVIGSRLFSRTPWWRSVAPGLTLFDDGGPDARPWLPAPASRFVAFAN